LELSIIEFELNIAAEECRERLLVSLPNHGVKEAPNSLPVAMMSSEFLLSRCPKQGRTWWCETPGLGRLMSHADAVFDSVTLGTIWPVLTDAASHTLWIFTSAEQPPRFLALDCQVVGPLWPAIASSQQ
jgi:hypothetical protein